MKYILIVSAIILEIFYVVIFENDDNDTNINSSLVYGNEI